MKPRATIERVLRACEYSRPLPEDTHRVVADAALVAALQWVLDDYEGPLRSSPPPPSETLEWGPNEWVEILERRRIATM